MRSRARPQRDASPEQRALRIVTQYWRGRVHVCELEAFGQILDLHFSQDKIASTWCVEARNGHQSGAHALSETALTRTDALTAVGRAWRERAQTLGLRSFDWSAVELALRAIGILD